LTLLGTEDLTAIPQEGYSHEKTLELMEIIKKYDRKATNVFYFIPRVFITSIFNELKDLI
jgi:hypothetical protein